MREIRDSETSLVGFGDRSGQAVVLKIVRVGLDEWDSGAVTAAFQGRGMVRVLEHEPGAVLLEEVRPGTSLVRMVLQGEDRAATQVLAGVIGSMHEVPASWGGATPVERLGTAFDRYLEQDDTRIEWKLAWDARNRFRSLCDTQRERRLLHGDLQHANVLFDEQRGWIALDPKGLSGELEYEIGATFRNPREAADHYPRRSTIESRLRVICSALGVDAARVLEWSYVQAVLSAIWVTEDGGSPDDATLQLAVALRGLLA